MGENEQAEIKALRKELQTLKTDLAVLRVEHDNALAKQNEITNIIGRVVWIVFGGILMAFTGWMVKGGFHDPN